MRRRFREAAEVQEIREAQRPGNRSQQVHAGGEDIDPLEMLSVIADDPDDSQHLWKKEKENFDPLEAKNTIEDDPLDSMSADDLKELLLGDGDRETDPLELKDTIEDDPDEPVEDQPEEEMSEEDLWWERQMEKDAMILRDGAQAPEMGDDIESIEAFEKGQTKGKERTADLEDRER